MSGEKAGALRNQRQQKEQARGKENREGKAGKIQLGHGGDVFSGHSEANAPSGSQKQQKFDIH